MNRNPFSTQQSYAKFPAQDRAGDVLAKLYPVSYKKWDLYWLLASIVLIPTWFAGIGMATTWYGKILCVFPPVGVVNFFRVLWKILAGY